MLTNNHTPIFFKILIWFSFVFGAISLIIFSFPKLDIWLSIVSSRLNKYMFFKWYEEINDSFGIGVTIFVTFILVSVLLESFFQYIKKRNDLGKKNEWINRNQNILAITWYVIAFIIWTIWIVHWEIDASTKDMGFGIGNDVSYFGPMYIRIATQAFTGVVGYCIILFTSIWMRTKVSKNPLFTELKYFEKALKISFYVLFTNLTVFFLKMFFGRPSYLAMMWDKSPAMGALSANEIASKLGWISSTNKNDILHYNPNAWVYKQTDYQLWWEPYHLVDNLKHWFWKKPKDDNVDMWWNLWFPSGHYFSFTLFPTMTAFLFVSHKKGDKFKSWKIIALILMWLTPISISFTLLSKRGHYMSDISFSMLSSPIIWFLSGKLVNKRIGHMVIDFEKRFKNNTIEYNYIPIKNSKSKMYIKYYNELKFIKIIKN